MMLNVSAVIVIMDLVFMIHPPFLVFFVFYLYSVNKTQMYFSLLYVICFNIAIKNINYYDMQKYTKLNNLQLSINK